MNKIRVGLEVHITLTTASKLFSAAPQNPFALPNTSTSLIDWGYPGALPQVNIEAVKRAYQLGRLLNCHLANFVAFDRKHYYYFDLPKGYQITQYFRPLGSNGAVELYCPGDVWKRIPITTAHLEEDTAQTLHQSDRLLINYNRAGNPLVEVTTAPVFTTFGEIKAFLEYLIRCLKRHQLSSASLKTGTIRVDLNVSSQVDPAQQLWHVRNEIKNLNDLGNIKKALEQEVAQQAANFTAQTTMWKQSWTKTFAERTQRLELLRRKRTANEYMFIPEANILPIALDQTTCQQWLAALNPTLTEAEMIKLYKLTFLDATLLFRHDLQKWFAHLYQHHLPTALILRFFTQILLPTRVAFAPLAAPNELVGLATAILQFYHQKPFSWKHFQTVFRKAWKTPTLDWKAELSALLTPATADLATTETVIKTVLAAHPTSQKRYQTNPHATLRFLTGQVMRRSPLRLDPIQVQTLLKKHLTASRN